MHKKILFAAIIGTIFFLTCKNGNSANNENLNKKLPVNFSREEFKTWAVDKQVEFINSLEKESKFKFLEIFLPNNDFISPPNDEISFLNNGKILIFSIKPKNAYTTAYWELKKNRLRAYKKNKKIRFPVNRDDEIWMDIKARKTSYKPSELSLEFLTDKGEITGFLIYEKHGSPALRSYKR
jgi:hypothetical protein